MALRRPARRARKALAKDEPCIVSEGLAKRARSRTTADSTASMTELVLPNDANAHGTVFGGKVLQWIDLAAAIVALRHARRPVVTAAFDRVDFIPLGGMRVLVVIVARGGHVIQKAIDVAEELDADDLRHAANYLNAEFSGLPLSRAREAFRQAFERLGDDHE